MKVRINTRWLRLKISKEIQNHNKRWSQNSFKWLQGLDQAKVHHNKTKARWEQRKYCSSSMSQWRPITSSGKISKGLSKRKRVKWQKKVFFCIDKTFVADDSLMFISRILTKQTSPSCSNESYLDLLHNMNKGSLAEIVKQMG